MSVWFHLDAVELDLQSFGEQEPQLLVGFACVQNQLGPVDEGFSGGESGDLGLLSVVAEGDVDPKPTRLDHFPLAPAQPTVALSHRGTGAKITVNKTPIISCFGFIGVRRLGD